MVIVGTPDLVANFKTDKVEDLLDLPWLQELGTNEVADWFRYRGIVADRPINISQMPGNLIMNAVRGGNGITYSARAFFTDDIAAGRIVELFSEPLFGLYYVQTSSEPLRPAVKRFVDWLLANAVEVDG